MTGLKSVHVSLNVEVKQLLYHFVLNPCLVLSYRLEAAAKLFTNKIYNKGTLFSFIIFLFCICT